VAATPPRQLNAVRIKTVIGDSSPVAALGVEQCLAADGFDICGIVSDVRSLVAVVELSQPNLIVVGFSPTTRVEWLKAVTGLIDRYSSRVLAFTSDLSSAAVHAALEGGCLGVVPRTTSVELFVEGARAVAAGRQHIHQLAVAAALRGIREVDGAEGRPTLSAREAGVLALVSEGLTNALIAHRLGISPATVKTHVERLLRKLGATDRAQAVGNAMRMGMLP